MKDSYSFDLTDEGLVESYAKHREAYIRIFDRLGLRYVIVSAMSGAMGGSASEEFLAAPSRARTRSSAARGGYAANVEAVVTPAPPAQPVEEGPRRRCTTRRHADDRVARRLLTARASAAPFTAADTLKNVLVKTRRPARTGELLAVGVPGDREVDMKRLEASLRRPRSRCSSEPTSPRTRSWSRATSARARSRRTASASSSTPGSSPARPGSPGADKADHHVVNLVAGRDFTPDGTIEAAEVAPATRRPDGEGVLEAARGIEIGHIFQLGRKYADAFALDALGPDGKPVRITMGSYGVGVSRLVAAIAEQTPRRARPGLAARRSPRPTCTWSPREGGRDPEGAEALAGELTPRASGCCSTTATASPGVKFADAELIGVPTIVVVGRGLQSGVVEVKDRRTGQRTEVALASAVDHLVELTGKR